QFLAGSYGYVLGYRDAQGHKGATRDQPLQPLAADRPPRFGEHGLEDVDLSEANSPNHQLAGQNVLYVDGSVRWLSGRTVRGDDLFTNANRVVGAGVGAGDAVIGVSEAVPYPTSDSLEL
ncbi:MAG: hypothetical protein ACRC1K_05980, partial [Planctomycetia bacterium]